MTDPKQEMRARFEKWARQFEYGDTVAWEEWAFERDNDGDYASASMGWALEAWKAAASSERDRARELACGEVRKVMGNNSIPEAAIRQAFEEER